MGREVRRVPKDWSHPIRDDGSYQPMYDESYEHEAKEWMENAIAWYEGRHPNQTEDEWARESAKKYKYFWEWTSGPPDEEYYRPDWKEEERTHLQMYETCSEGTPISPVMETPEELARWLADNDASAFGRMTATYEQWLNVCKGGFACSAIAVVKDGHGKLMSGVEATTELQDN